jgi:pilus assembly protein CpaB
VQRLTSSRTGTLILGIAAAMVAGVLLLAYVSQVRKNADAQSSTVSVLVADRFIPQNSSGDVIASQKWYSIVKTPNDQVNDGAITDPSTMSGKVTASDIAVGHQLTTDDFVAAPSQAVTTKLTGTERAISIPLDSSAGLTPFLQAGDRVDILAGFNVVPIGKDGAPLSGSAQARPVLKAIAQDVPVLEVPASDSSKSGSSGTGNVVVKVTDQQAWQIAFAIDNGRVFLSGSASTGNESSRPTLITLETVLLGVPAVKVYHSFGAH